jgi:hypothetical protein
MSKKRRATPEKNPTLVQAQQTFLQSWKEEAEVSLAQAREALGLASTALDAVEERLREIV